jgi:hypothetical protein
MVECCQNGVLYKLELEVWSSSKGSWRRNRPVWWVRGDSLVPVWSCPLVQSLLVLWSWDRALSYCVVRPPGPGIPICATVT